MAILRDRRFHQFAAKLAELAGLRTPSSSPERRQSILTTEGDAHGRLRRIVAPAFTPKAADRLRPYMREVMERLLDPVAPTGRLELVGDVCDPYPIPIVCRLLGAPEEDWKLFSRWAADLLRIFNFNFTEDLPVIAAAQDAVGAYVREMIARRRTEPADDLLTDLIAAEESGDRLSTEELESMAIAVLIAGTDTTRNQLGCSVALFMEQPDQWALLVERPELAARAVEESMRYLGAIDGTARFASEDVEFRGVLFPKDTAISDELRGRQPRRARLRRPDHARHHARVDLSPPDVRQRHPLLPRRLAGPGRAAGGAADPGPPPARPRPRRSGRVEAEHGRHLGPGPRTADVHAQLTELMRDERAHG